jgi:hypothetical protein
MTAFPRLRSSLATLPLLAALAACGPAAVTETTSPAVEVAVSPANVQVAPGGNVSFSATVTGSADTSVAWLVASPTSGTVSTSGVYTAPTVAGTYEVKAQSKAKGNAWGKATVTVTPTPIAVGVSPATASVVAGGQVTFAAAVSGTTNTAVTWSVVEAGCGAITASGVYTAGAAAGTCHVAAASVADPSLVSQATVTVTVTVTPPPVISVSVAPASAAVDACRTVTLSANVTGTSNGAVTWSVAEGAAGGTITSAGVYTAPTLAGTYHAVATSQADPTRTSTATIVVAQRVLSLAVSPATVSVPQGGSAQFTATVTTTCGTAVATQTVTAPSALQAN